ncbi:MAG: phosphate signaling complex protein PhoU [Methylacidiphilales bacterium]|nr:phosphate signaling complex protein PhoU [Candidatus Methylacidiphilales bacterium]
MPAPFSNTYSNGPASEQITKIRETLLLMASLTTRNLTLALRALVERDEKLAASVEAEDSQLDELEISVDELVINHMATHAPVATDCRFMLVASKISSNLERIADQAVAIARRSLELNKEPLLKPLIDIPRMAQIAEGMLRDGMTALIERKPELAQEIIRRDKEVDMINKQLARELTSFMLEDPTTITRALNLTLVARSLERIADHCKNIAEEVYYLYQAVDIRHERVGSPQA